MNLFPFDRKQLAVLTEKVVEQYFLWITKKKMIIPLFPDQYQEKPLEYIRKYMRICGLMKVSDGTWTPFFRSTCYRGSNGIWNLQEVLADLPQQADAESSCPISISSSPETPRPIFKKSS